MTLIKPKFTVACVHCGGQGSYDTPHPQWGSRTCPEAYVNVDCPECNGDGWLDYDRAQLCETLDSLLTEGWWRARRAKQETPCKAMVEPLVARLKDMGVVKAPQGAALSDDLFALLSAEEDQPYEEVAEAMVQRLEAMDLVPQAG